jgi:hypothetical protein
MATVHAGIACGRLIRSGKELYKHSDGKVILTGMQEMGGVSTEFSGAADLHIKKQQPVSNQPGGSGTFFHAEKISFL